MVNKKDFSKTLLIFAFIVEFILGLRYLDSLFGQFCIVINFNILLGMLIYPILKKTSNLKEKNILKLKIIDLKKKNDNLIIITIKKEKGSE